MSDLAVDASPTGMVVCDDGGTVLLANRHIEILFGYTVSELLGRNIDTLVPVDVSSAQGTERGRYWTHPESRPMGAGRQLDGQRKDGTRMPVEVGLTVTDRDGQRLVVVSIVDISERLAREGAHRSETADRLRLERLISNLSAAFVNIAPEKVDETITDGLRQMVEALDLDRSALWQFTENDDDLVYTHVWVRPEYPPTPVQFSTREFFPWMLSKVRANEAIWNETIDDVPHPVDRENLRRFDTRSFAVIPFQVDGRVIGALSFASLGQNQPWRTEIRDRIQLAAMVFSQALALKKSQAQLQKVLAEVEGLRRNLAIENAQLRAEVKSLIGPRALAAESGAVREVLAQVRSVAPTTSTVLLLGETGSGKEVFAQAIHNLSQRRDRPMVRVNCAAIPAALIENELFGRERGAYTGALSRQAGRFELADGATLFLDEIGDLPLESQAKLLRVIQDRVVERLGSTRAIEVDVRLIAATNRNLEQAVADRTFREDLFYRLNVFPVHVPPLRDRPEDIPVLVWTFVEEFCKQFGKRIDSISKESLKALREHSWPGNVRELRNVIERAIILAKGPTLVVDLPQLAAPAATVPGRALNEIEAGHIRAVLEQVGWRVRGSGGAADVLGMKPTTLDSRMAKLGIRRPR